MNAPYGSSTHQRKDILKKEDREESTSYKGMYINDDAVPLVCSEKYWVFTNDKKRRLFAEMCSDIAKMAENKQSKRVLLSRYDSSFQRSRYAVTASGSRVLGRGGGFRMHLTC